MGDIDWKKVAWLIAIILIPVLMPVSFFVWKYEEAKVFTAIWFVVMFGLVISVSIFNGMMGWEVIPLLKH